MTLQNEQNQCAQSKDSDQPGLPPSLIRVFVVYSTGRLASVLKIFFLQCIIS